MKSSATVDSTQSLWLLKKTVKQVEDYQQMTNTLPQAIALAVDYADTVVDSNDFWGAIKELPDYSENLSQVADEIAGEFICLHEKEAYLFELDGFDHVARRIGRPEVILTERDLGGRKYKGDKLQLALESLRSDLEKVFPEITWVVSLAEGTPETPFWLEFCDRIDLIIKNVTGRDGLLVVAIAEE